MSTQEEVKQETPKRQDSAPTPTRGRRKAFTIFFVVLLVLGAAGLLLWMRAQKFEDTDDAQVEAHLNPISSRVDGTITKVYVDDNQSVNAGAPLVDLDPRDFRVAFDQAQAQLTQARSMVIGQEPNVPITQVENTTNISSGEADVATARAALGVAQRDRDTAMRETCRSGSKQRPCASRLGALQTSDRKRRSVSTGIRPDCSDS